MIVRLLEPRLRVYIGLRRVHMCMERAQHLRADFVRLCGCVDASRLASISVWRWLVQKSSAKALCFRSCETRQCIATS